jgi:3-oxoacyl-[acyl-carrier-protein] synthase II
MGVVSPFGCGIAALWEGVSHGRSAARPITLFDAADLPVRFACEVPGDFPPHPTERVSAFALEAAQQAWKSAGAPSVDPRRIGVSLAVGHLGNEASWFPDEVAWIGEERPDPADPNLIDIALQRLLPAYGGVESLERALHPDGLLVDVARACGAEGPAAVVHTSCPASLQAAILAAEQIRDGEADLVVTGGAESMINPVGMMSFARMQALSTNNEEYASASRPFDRTRDGFVMGEGAGMLVLEDFDHALRRAAPILGEWLGAGMSCDAYRLCDEHPEGVGAVAALQAALREAAVAPDAIDYVNAHGSSTPMNDRIETLALKAALGDHARAVPISSTKSMHGHLIHAAAAVEVIVTLLAMRHGIVPPTAHLRQRDPLCDLDYVPNEARAARVEHAVKTSFGFGGINAALVLRRHS